MPPGRRATRGGFGLLLLASQIMNIGPCRIPPITLITVALNAIVYMKLIPSLPSVHGACTSNNYVVSQRQWLRLCTSSFYHLDDMHLYYNMASFIWKGMKLENKMGSRKFAIVIAVFSVLTQVVMLAVNKVFAEVFVDDQYLSTCAAGFSAVIFSLKVLTTYNSDGNERVMGLLSVPSRYACWVELVLIHVLVPRSSFTGHLSGILVGLLYTHGPLKKLVNGMKYLFNAIVERQPAVPAAGTYRRQAEATGYRDSAEDSAEVQRAIQESLRNTSFNTPSSQQRQQQQQQRPPSYGWNVPGDTNNSNTRTYNNLYPNIPTDDVGGSGRSNPTAPPYDPGNDSPYPTSSHFPTVPPPSHQNYPSSSNDQGSSEDAMRQARLRKFEKK